MSVSPTDYALLAQDSYKDPVLNKPIILGGVTYRAIDYANDPVTGYQGTAYKRVDTGEIIIAHRGTEFGREPLQDGVIADGGMVFTGLNSQTSDAMAFTQKVMNEAKHEAEQKHQPAPSITVTGHSLGGTLAEITAYKYGLHGETFNAYGAAGLLEGVPKGGNQIIDNVRATDVVSAGSAHFGQVRVYATQQDIDALSKAGYRDNNTLLTPREPILGKIQADAHAIDNFVPNGKTLGQSIMTPENAARYEAHQGMVDRYRKDVLDLRTGLSASWEVPKAVVTGAEALGHAAGEKITQGIHAAEHAAHVVAHDASQAYNTARHTVTEKVSQGVHAAEHVAHVVAHDATQAYDTVRKEVSHGFVAAEHAAGKVAHEASQALHAAGHAMSEAGHAVGEKVSSAFDTFSHPGSWFDHKPATPAAAAPARLDHSSHPDHALYQQSLGAVHRLDAQHQHVPDQRSSNLAAALVVAARRDGLSQIHHAVLSDDAKHTYAVQGDLHSSFKRITHVHTAEAVATPVEKSSAAWEQAAQARHANQAQLSQQQEHQQTQNRGNPAQTV
ncbi:XVIPCD domain-containing protein [Dyella silvatica]|uniref:XVIPCD domain-containing protein n=1 Tax=Dyella silvatica TaxID=2992128 RepID=UPI00224F6A31|nr:XVIPCD domain-containing protein [Dyella silvatica]